MPTGRKKAARTSATAAEKRVDEADKLARKERLLAKNHPEQAALRQVAALQLQRSWRRWRARRPERRKMAATHCIADLVREHGEDLPVASLPVACTSALRAAYDNRKLNRLLEGLSCSEMHAYCPARGGGLMLSVSTPEENAADADATEAKPKEKKSGH